MFRQTFFSGIASRRPGAREAGKAFELERRKEKKRGKGRKAKRNRDEERRGRGNAARRNHKLAFVIDGRRSGRSFAGRYLASISRRVIAVSRVTPKPLVTRFDVSSSAFVPPFFHRLSRFFFLDPLSRASRPRFALLHRNSPKPPNYTDHSPRLSLGTSRFRATSFPTRDFFSLLKTVYDVADRLTDRHAGNE